MGDREVGRRGHVVAFLAVTVLTLVSFVPNAGAHTLTMPGSTILADVGDARPTPADVIRPRPAASPVTTADVIGDRGLAGWFVSGVLVILNATDDVAVASTWFRIADGPWQPYGGPISVSEDGNHTLDFFSIDRDGNAEDPKGTFVPVDRTPPAFVTVRPQGIVTTSSVVVSWEAQDAASGVARHEVSVDGGPNVLVGKETSQQLTLADGVHTVLLRAFDVAGNDGETEYTFQVDTFVLSPTGPQGTMILALIFGVNVAGVMAAVMLRRRKRS